MNNDRVLIVDELLDKAYQQGRADYEEECKKRYCCYAGKDCIIGNLVAEDYYNQGKEDADEFLAKWKDAVVEDMCKYDAETIDDVYRKGREDALEELTEYIRENQFNSVIVESWCSNIGMCDFGKVVELFLRYTGEGEQNDY